MNDTTEPIIAVIGHPIAGNPSQLALERAFASMKLDWRVMSFDVAPENLTVALAGLEVLGVRGVMIGSSLASHAAKWATGHMPDQAGASRIDCFYRDLSVRSGLLGVDSESQFLSEHIKNFLEKSGEIVHPKPFAIGQFSQTWIDWFSPDERESIRNQLTENGTFDPDAIEGANVLLLGDADEISAALEEEDWSRCDRAAMVIDLSQNESLLSNLDRMEKKILNTDDRRVGIICTCIERWTGKKPSTEIICDAIEEYMAV